MVYQLSTWLE